MRWMYIFEPIETWNHNNMAEKQTKDEYIIYGCALFTITFGRRNETGLHGCFTTIPKIN